MFKKIISVLLSLLVLSACNSSKESEEYSKFQVDFMGLFDTYSVIVGYAKEQDEFTKYGQVIYDSLERQQKYFDIYKDYEGVNNLKTINDNAGIEPVKVDREIIDLLKLCKEAYYETDGVVNVAMGSVLRIWHEYRTQGIDNPNEAKLPPMEELEKAKLNTNIEDLIIDEENSTVFLKNKGMSLDVGGIAKGYATDIAAREAKEAGLESALLSIGGNIVSIGKPLDGIRDRWGVGVQDPELSVDGVNNIIDTIFVNDMAVVSSGDYQRYYFVDGKRYNHIIDLNTLMPADIFKEVTVLHEDSGMADMLSTAIYILPHEEGKALIERIGAEALWIFKDGEIVATEGYEKISKKFNNYSAVDK